MTNSTKQVTTGSSTSLAMGAVNKTKLAGMWLIVCGIILSALLYNPAEINAAEAIEWSTVWLVGLGFCVALELRFAAAIARVLGSSAILFLLIMGLYSLFGMVGQDELPKGSVVGPQPSASQIAMLGVCLSVTFLPPWWWLQTALRPKL